MNERVAVGIRSVEQVAVTARDLERGVAFYRDVLGLELLFEVPGAAFFRCGEVRLMLAVPGAGEHDHPASIVYYRVEDLESSYRALQDRGVESVQAPHRVGRMGETEVWMAFLRDPEGNVFALSGERDGG